MNRQKSLKRFSFTLIWVWGVLLLPCWFSLNNSETVKDVTLAFCSIQKLFIKDICVKFGIPNSPQSPDIDQNSDGCISIFSVTGEFFINENGHNSRTGHDIDMRLGPVTKLDERNTITSKKIDHDVTSEIITSYCDSVSLIYGQFAAIQELDSRCMVYKTYIFINSNILSYLKNL